jgi:hypothetical protein
MSPIRFSTRRATGTMIATIKAVKYTMNRVWSRIRGSSGGPRRPL